jgi:hypothetical protein
MRALALWLFTLRSICGASAIHGPGLEVRQYLVGTISEVVGRIAVTQKTEVDLGGGVDVAYHGRQGVQDRENGFGYGVSGGVRLYLVNPLFFGIRTDVWRTTIDWTNHSNSNLPPSGTSRLIVLQPTVEVGSNFQFGNLWFSPALSFGAEINTFVNGAPTGQGLILLLGLTMLWGPDH